MKILNRSNKKVVEVSNERQISRMLRYPDLFEQVEEPKTENKKDTKKVEEPKTEV